MTGQDALWSVLEVRAQAEQSRGQVDIWEAIAETRPDICAVCNRYADEAFHGRCGACWQCGAVPGKDSCGAFCRGAR